MNGVRFIVDGVPQGKGRPRFYKGHAVTPAKTREYEKHVRACYLNECARPFMNGEPVAVFIRACFPIPKSYTKKRIELIRRGEEQPTKKPDADNIAKIILDAINGIAWSDDTQVVSLTIDKAYTFGEPYVLVSISELDAEEVERMELRQNGNEKNVFKSDCAK